MSTYNPGKFQSTYDTKLGHAIWDFLNEHDNLIRMETASELKRPALEALATRIAAKFGTPAKDDRVKQMTGHMVRQIMESRGFNHDVYHIKVRVGDVFTYASRYRR